MIKTRSAPLTVGLILLIALIVAAGGIHFAFLQNVWIDESTQLSGIKLGLTRLLLWLSGTAVPEFGVPADRMPPVSYIIDGIFGRLAGFEPIGFRLLHLVITLAGVITLVLMMLRRFGYRAAAATGLFLALSPKLIDVSVEIRAYPIFLALTCIQIVMFIRLYERERTYPSHIAAFALVGLLSAYLHFFGIISTSAFFAALFLGTKDRQSAAIVVAGYVAFLILSIGLAPFIVGASSISTVSEQSSISPSGLVEFALRLIGHSSTMLSTPAAAFYLTSAAGLMGLSVFAMARQFRNDGLSARANPVFGLAVVLASGLAATIFAALVVRGFNPLKISYNIWMLPVIAVLIGAALTADAGKLVNAMQTGFASLLLIGALWTHGLFLMHAHWFVHGPEKSLVRQIEQAGAETAVVYEGPSWGYGYFPLYWRYRKDVPQWVVADDGKSVQQIGLSAVIGNKGQSLSSLNRYKHLIYARIETKTYRDLKVLLDGSHAVERQDMHTQTLTNNGWRVGATIEKPGLYWLTSTTLDRKAEPQ